MVKMTTDLDLCGIRALGSAYYTALKFLNGYLWCNLFDLFPSLSESRNNNII